MSDGTKKAITIGVIVPAWMRSDVLAARLHDRVQPIVRELPFRAPDDAMEAIVAAVVKAYIAGYGDGRGLLEHHAASEEDAKRLADTIISHEAEEAEGDHLAIAAFVRRVAGIIEERGLVQASAGAPKGLPS